jgi:hypothetical protein
MSDHDAFAERGRALEEDHFRKRDRELVEKMRKAADAAKNRDELGRSTGLSDPAVLQDLLDLGFTPDTVALLPLVPVVEMAWAEGGVSPAERDLIVKLARARGIAEGSVADRQLSQWLASRPSPAVFDQAGRLIRALLDSGSGQTQNLTSEDLVKYAEAIAAASGGILGIGRVSAEERALLSRIESDLKSRG